MSIFGKKTEQVSDGDGLSKTNLDALREAVMRAEEGVLAKLEEGFAKELEADRLDRETYQFECRRWGDFLSLYMARGNWDKGRWEVTKQCAAINLGDVQAFSLSNGRPPDRDGEVFYGYGVNFMKGGWDGQKVTPFGDTQYHDSRTFYVGDRYLIESDPYRWLGPYTSMHKHRTPFFRSARSDQIHFVESKANILCPHGMGQAVMDKLLEAIGDGSK